jgi:hypothetical protein
MKHQDLAARTALALLLAATTSVFSPVPMYAQQALPPREDPIVLYREAGINGAQEKKIMALVNAYEKLADEKAHELIAHLNRLRALSNVADLDEKLVLQTQENINKLQNGMAMEKIHLLINIRRILNSEQKVRLVSLLQKRNKNSSAITP